MTSADAAFNVADVNHDGGIDQSEFRRFVGGSGVGAGGYGGGSSYGASYGGGLGGGVSSYESSSFESSSAGGLGGGYGSAGYGGAVYGGGASYGNGYDAGYGAGASSYESSSYSSGGGGYGADAGYGAASYGAGSYGAGSYGGAVGLGGGVGGGQFTSQSTSVQQYATDAQGLFQDSNPQIIRRPAPQGPQTYTQNIRVRFLQPPPIPPHGPLIIREVRPPQPPAPPPLRIRQQAPPLPTPPPLVLRERPPPQPQSIASQTVIRRLQALPVPPRSVIIERLPPLPPRPRDIIIERWVPYGPQAQRRTIVQRAAAAQQYQAPRNVIIQYEPVQARIVRQFQRLGVSAENPAAYVARYGGSLLDAGTLIAQARAAGVVEDIAPAVGYSQQVYGQESSFAASSGYEGGAALGGGYSAGGLGGGYSEQSYSESVNVGGGGGGGYGIGGGVGLGGSSSYESSSFSSGGGSSGNLTYPIGLDVGVAGFVQNPASYERFQASSGLEQHGYGVGGDVAIGAPDLASRVSQYDAAGAMFNYADVNHDGRIDRNEFGSFFRAV